MKYEITEESCELELKTLYRIRALKDFNDVKAGDIGGWVQTKNNLSQEGDCWIYDEAIAMDMARIRDSVRIKDNAIISGHAKVLDNATVTNSAKLFDRCHVYGNTKVQGFSQIYGEAEVFGNVVLKDQAKAHKSAWVSGDIVLDKTMNVTERTTRTPINISGLSYNITIMDNHACFDCETRTHREWMNMSDAELTKLHGIKAVRFNKLYRRMLIEMADIHCMDNLTNI